MDKSYTIVSYCNEAYREVLYLALPSWLLFSGAEKIHIFTDGDWYVEWLDNVKKLCEGTDVQWDRLTFESRREGSIVSGNWVDSLQDYVDSFARYMNDRSVDGEWVLFIGADIMILKSFLDVFHLLLQEKKEMAACRFQQSRFTLNCGAFISTVTTRDFAVRWSKFSKAMLEAKVGIPGGHQVAYDQISFSVLIYMYAKLVLSLQESVLFNCSDDRWDWIERLEKIKSALYSLHFKGGKWKDREYVKMLFKRVGITYGQLDCLLELLPEMEEKDEDQNQEPEG